MVSMYHPVSLPHTDDHETIDCPHCGLPICAVYPADGDTGPYCEITFYATGVDHVCKPIHLWATDPGSSNFAYRRDSDNAVPAACGEWIEAVESITALQAAVTCEPCLNTVAECSSCHDSIGALYRMQQDLGGDILCAGCIVGEGVCHLCGEGIQYCQGHAGETCDCICDEGCDCGDCGFDEVATVVEQSGAELIAV